MAARMVVEATDGFEVAGESETGEDSVEKARELDPDLVLMDVNLPGHQRPGGDPADPVAAPTAWSSCWSRPTRRTSTRPRAAECGAAAYIPKAELDPDRLSEAWDAASAA